MKTKASVSTHSDSNPNIENLDRLNLLEMQVKRMASEHATMASEHASIAKELAAMRGNGHYNGNGTSFPENAEDTAPTDRRSMLKKVGALAAGVAAVGLLRPSSSKAKAAPNATGGNFILGNFNTANAGDYTELANPNVNLESLILVVENRVTDSFHAIPGSRIASASYISNAGSPTTSGTFYGLYAKADTPAGGLAIGVYGLAGAHGCGCDGTSNGATDSVGVVGNSDIGLGGTFVGGRGAIRLQAGAGAVANPNITPPSGSNIGDLYCGSTDGSVWYRTTAASNPYRRLADATTAGQLTLLDVAVRYVDTRVAGGGGAFSPGEIRAYNFTTLQAGTIPVGARGIVGNIVAVDPNTTGNLQIDPTGIFAAGSAAVLNFNPGQDISNHFVTALAGNGNLSVKANPNGGSVQLVIDIYGYYL
jgi:hypothetical protein